MTANMNKKKGKLTSLKQENYINIISVWFCEYCLQQVLRTPAPFLLNSVNYLTCHIHSTATLRKKKIIWILIFTNYRYHCF